MSYYNTNFNIFSKDVILYYEFKHKYPLRHFFPTSWKINIENLTYYIGIKCLPVKKIKRFNMSTEYEHIKQYSQNSFTLECEICQQAFPALSVRSHLRTKNHQKNSIEFTKQIMLKESAHRSIYQSNFKVDSS